MNTDPELLPPSPAAILGMPQKLVFVASKMPDLLVSGANIDGVFHPRQEDESPREFRQRLMDAYGPRTGVAILAYDNPMVH